MNFGRLGKVESAQKYLDIAFNQAKEHASEVIKTMKGSPFQRLQRKELAAINTVKTALEKHFMLILKSFPSMTDFDPFYRELVKCVVDVGQVRQSLGGINWGVQRITAIFREFNDKIRNAHDEETVLKHKRAYYGRVSSVVKQLKDDFEILDDARKQLKVLPTLKTSIPTVVIAGFPNVGKSTLLKALTGSSPEIASYPFTTKQMMLGYRTEGGKKWQFVDTPGLLDRPLGKKNNIEKQAALALKYLAKVVIFIIDPTESCGYPLEDQKHLLKDVAKSLEVPVIVALNKADFATTEQLAAAGEHTQNAVIVSAEKGQGIDELVKLIAKHVS
ncbi:MAG TPA: GTPase [Candidatus Binatia bacterium]|nr:GTPase [Candidatus Binatia bacterium]